MPFGVFCDRAGNSNVDGDDRNYLFRSRSPQNCQINFKSAYHNEKIFANQCDNHIVVQTPFSRPRTGGQRCHEVDTITIISVEVAATMPFTANQDMTLSTARKGHDTMRGGQGRDLIQGSKGSDHLIGHQQHDLLRGGDGNDILRGNSGHDTLHGGKGHDTMRGGRGHDQIQGSKGSDHLIGHQQHDLLRGPGRDVLLGNQAETPLMAVVVMT